MSFNNRNLNPNIWDAPRHNNPQPFINSQPNFFGNNNNFPRPNFQQNNHSIRPLLSLPLAPGQHDNHQNFRNFNNNNSNRGRPNFHNQQKWQNRGNDNKDSRFGDNFSSSSNSERFSHDDEDPSTHDDVRPKSLVEHLKSTMKKNPRSKSQENTNESIDACAKNASKKLLSQLKTMDKDNVKELINNPKQPHKKAVLNIQAREKLREGMRKQLNKLGAEDDQEASFDAVESVNYENIPETLIAQIGRTVDIDLNVEDMDLQQEMDDEIIEDKDIEVVKKNLGNDFLYGSEMLLMNGFNLLGESENESEMKINDDRFFPPPLPAEPISKPPEPVPPPESPSSNINNINAAWQIKQPPQRFENDWEIDSARNPDPPNLQQNRTSNTEKIQTIQTIPVIVSNPQPQIVPHSSNVDNSSSMPKKNENPLLISLSEAKEQIVPKTNTNLRSLTEETVIKTPQASVSQESFKTPSIPDLISSTPKSFDGGKTPFISEDFGKTPFINDDGSKTPFEGTSTPSENKQTPESTEETPPKLEKRANETYGEYRRRLAGQADEENNKPIQRPKNQRKQFDNESSPSPQQQNQQNDKGIWNNSNNNNSIWNNNNFNNNNDKNNRKSRFEMNRSRDRNNANNNSRNDRNNFNNNKNTKNNNNNNNNRNNSREGNNSFWENRDKETSSKDMRDAFNYRFDNSNKDSHDGNEIDRLNTLLNPKQVQFKGSFNKRAAYPASSNSNRDFNRSRSRERTPTPASSSVEREFGDISSINDVRPCYHLLKKIGEIEQEISRIHDKIHGIDKVITNLQSERVAYQKSFTKLQHDKKVLYDNLLKRAMQNDNNDRTTSKEREKDNNKEKIIEPVSIKKEKESSKKSSETSSTDHKKRRVEEVPVVPQEDETRKKKKYALEEEPKSAAQKAKEKEEEDRRKRIEEIRRNKQLRREREEAERRRLEEEAKRESNDTILIINRDKGKDKEKEKDKERKKDKEQISAQSPAKSHKPEKHYMFSWSDVIDPCDVEMKIFKIQFEKMAFTENILEQFTSERYPEINVNELKELVVLSTEPVATNNVDKIEEKVVIKTEKIVDEKKVKEEESASKQSKLDDPLANLPSQVIDELKDPLEMDENQVITNPPTPGSSLTLTENDDTNICEQVNEKDYTEWTGNFESHDQPIVHIQNINDKQMVCAAEDGKLYKYNLTTGQCEATFTKHTEICNSFLYDDRDDHIYTVSSDGYVYRIKFKLFDSIESKQFNEALQVIEKSKYALYVGAKSGNIYKLKMDLSDEEMEPLCCVDSLILCMRWTKEGSRHILLISSRMNAIQVRDSNDGLLLRTLSNDLTGVSIYDMLLDGSTIYCGSNLHEIFALDFTTGALIKKHSMNGAGAINVRIHKQHLIVACYDGNIYIFDLNADDDAVNITGPSNMLLAMDLWNDKIIASTKDKTLKIMSIPT